MRILLQRVSKAHVMVEQQIVGSIDRGFVLFVGISNSDTAMVVKKMANKVAYLRVFEDENQKMNLGLTEVGGRILSISQFTLYAECRKGRRPSFEEAARPEFAKELYELFNAELRACEKDVECGVFQSDMEVYLINDGPVTIMLDSEDC